MKLKKIAYFLTFCCIDSKSEIVEEVKKSSKAEEIELEKPQPIPVPQEESTFFAEKDLEAIVSNPEKSTKKKNKKKKIRKSQDITSNPPETVKIVTEPVQNPIIAYNLAKKPLKGILKKPRKFF